MIGQKELKLQFDKFEITNLPKSILLTGEVGSGRKTFVYWFANKISIPVVEVDSGVDSIRAIIGICAKLGSPTMFLLPNADRLSPAAQNALLKVLEEPPKQAYFILTCSQEDLVLSTIKSRCFSYRMDHYLSSELKDYILGKYPKFATESEDKLKKIYSICTCPGEIDLLLEQNLDEFLSYVQLVFDNIAVVSGANSFKISDKINLTDDSTKYNLELFWKAFMSMCIDINDNSMKKMTGVLITAKYYSDLKIKGLNRQMTFDNWILEIRKAWM